GKRSGRTAVHKATRDRTAAVQVLVAEDRRKVVRRRAERRVVVRAGKPLVAAPAVVTAVGDRRIHLFPRALPHIANPLDAGQPVEAETPRIAHAVREDLVAPWGGAEERIRRWRGVRRRRRVDVDPQDLAEE